MGTGASAAGREVYARALRASQIAKGAEVWVGAQLSAQLRCRVVFGVGDKNP